MQAEGRHAAIGRALQALADLVAPADLAQLAELQRRLREDRFRILVVGEAKRGKSTFVNALLGRRLLPTGVTPLTAVATTVTYGDREVVVVRYADGRAEQTTLDRLDELVTERGNPNNRLGVSAVTVVVDEPLLRLGVELVDTPGTGSVHAHNTAEAELALAAMDAAVFVLTADPPVAAAERELLERVAVSSVATFVVLNKIDYLAAEDLPEAVEFTAAVAGEVLGGPVRVFPLSASRALAASLAGRDLEQGTGLPAVREALLGYLTDHRSNALADSLAEQARRMALAARDSVRLTLRADQLRATASAGRVDAFAERLAVLDQQRRDARALAEGEARRMLAELNVAADDAVVRLGAQVRDGLCGWFAAQLPRLSAAEVDRAGRDRLVGLISAEVEPWRQERARLLEEELAALDRRLRASLDRELATVREAARELLDLDLSVGAAKASLLVDHRFHYVWAAEVDQLELLAGAIRRHLPGAVGRRRAADHLLRECESLVPRQVGRSRADLQYRLQETMRVFVSSLDRRYAEHSEKLAAALGAASRLDGLARADGEQERARWHHRDAQLAALLGTLDDTTVGRVAAEPA